MSDDSKAVPLATMLEDAEEFAVKGTKYMVRPLLLDEVPEFQEDGLSVGPQFFNLANEERSKALDKWIQRTVTCSGNKMSLANLKANKWTVKDLRKLLQKLIDVSG